MSRPPLSEDRFEQRPPDHVSIRFKHPWKDGTRAVLLSEVDFIARLAAIIPRPRAAQIRYFGVLAGHHRLRSRVVIGRAPVVPAVRQLELLAKAGSDSDPHKPWSVEDQLAHLDNNDRRKRPSSSHLLKRVFGFELGDCACGGTMRIVAAHTTADSIEAALRDRGLWAHDDARGPPVDTGQLCWQW